MQAMVHIWDGISFHHQPYRETGVSILTALDEIQTMLDDQIVRTQTMRGSPFIKPFEKEIKVSFKFWRMYLAEDDNKCAALQSFHSFFV